MKSYLLIIPFFFLLPNGFGQGIPEINHWFFSNESGLDFSSGTPVEEHGNVAYTEGCASISDKNGHLLFYTDGVKVWNKTHRIMPNGTGLKGQSSSTRAAIITQKPCSKNTFYIFTTTNEGNSDGLQYSEVNMKLDDGLGAITDKNIPLATPVNEKLTAVRHSNDNDIWLITRESSTDRFLSFLITSEGITTTPVISSAGSITDPTGVGHLKSSLDGRKLISVNTNGPSNVDILNFDPATGIVSTDFSFNPPFYAIYGAEFSPNGKLIYISSWSESYIYQYDLTLANPANIIVSQTLLGPCTIAYGWFQLVPAIGSIQLGPDGKIYFGTTYQTPAIGCIPNPNNPGTACGFIENAVQLEGLCEGNLPNFQMNYRYKTCNPLTIPNIITPNKDGINDLFQVKNLSPGRASLTISNRWGNTVFFSDSYLNDWNGEGLEDGVYFYLLNDLEEEETHSGFIEVIR